MNNFRSGFGAALPPVTLNIIIINVILWLAQVVFLRQGINLAELFGLHYRRLPGLSVGDIYVSSR